MLRTRSPILFALTLWACHSTTGQGASDVEATSLLGRELVRIEPDAARRVELEERLAESRARWTREGSEDAAIWVGRNLAYLGRYRAAIDWYGRRLGDFPESFRLRRHRGHRWISVREFGRAAQDLEEAWTLCEELPDEVEPDGAPNRYGIPRGTTKTSVLYHLALAAYLQGQFDAAASAWAECAWLSPNDDMRVAALNWLVHSLRRAGRHEEAAAALRPVTSDMRVIENLAYHQLLLLQAGERTPSDLLGEDEGEDGIASATLTYGVATWSWCNGNRERAQRMWREIVATTPWNAFGHIAAEAELARH